MGSLKTPMSHLQQIEKRKGPVLHWVLTNLSLRGLKRPHLSEIGLRNMPHDQITGHMVPGIAAAWFRKMS